MDEFRWIQMFLCLMLMNQIADDQNNCDGTTWIFTSRNKPKAAELITLGQISKEAKNQSDRLNVTVNCSLVIKKLRVEDVGRYYCQQYKVGQTPHTLVHQSVVLLSVIILTEHKDTNKVTLNCSVLTYEECHHTVKWLLKGRHLDKDNNQMMTSQTGCSTSVTFLDSHYLYSSRYNTVKCEVTDTETGRVQLFTFSPQTSGEETDIHWYIIAAVGSVSLLIIVVIFVGWKRNKGGSGSFLRYHQFHQDPPQSPGKL
ncbi:uncharacterized protein LOC115774601 [Archocentrus centrarchus]|uniref:uncharacterized protein LOC115774601 n=1 Tax=Archocentrus centrarchus TaxID=63155 RepID=UPI0011E9CA9F|nr:uncharacterized protein LOC115774601 [Archocentrus centrarchus]